jgi:hypothetical protein
MDRTFIKRIFISTLFIVFVFTCVQAQETKTIKLPDPTKKGGLPIMEAFSKRASDRSWADKDLSMQDLSNLLWTANGINRSDSKKRTAPSAMNAQDVDIYVIIKSGVYLYDAASHVLNLIVSGDHRSEVGMSMGGARPSSGSSGAPGATPGGAPGGAPGSAPGGTPGGAPGSAPAGAPSSAPGGKAASGPSGSSAAPAGMPSAPGGGSAQRSSAAASLVMVSDLSKFRMGTDESKKETGAIDAAIVSENIALFCAGNGLATVPRTGINKEGLKTLLKVKDTQYIVIENAVGYPAETK